MPCPTKKTIDGTEWPLHRESDASCVYRIEGTAKRVAAAAVAAESMPNYQKRSRGYEVDGKVRIYIYFGKR